MYSPYYPNNFPTEFTFDHFTTEFFTILGLHNPLIDVSELHKNCLSTNSEALNYTWYVWSGNSQVHQPTYFECKSSELCDLNNDKKENL